MEWHRSNNRRILPWKGERDAYKIWLSEIILQQTRAAQGLEYYNNFIKKYPSIVSLANAADADVYKLWEGLGYYTRCKNLLITARYIVNNLEGRFPDNYTDILTLKGIGPYTAAAISSFAYHLPHAVIDGNVFRVLARCFCIYTPIDTSEGKKTFTVLANQLLDKRSPSLYNQAIMDFGAVICKPVYPLCSQCPQQQICKAYLSGKVNELPVKEKTLNKKTRWFTYFIFTYSDSILVQQRIAKDIWQSLYEFYLVETTNYKQWNNESIDSYMANQFNVYDAVMKCISPVLSQQLTHQTIKAQFIKIILSKVPAVLQKFKWYRREQIQQLAFPKIINEYMQQESFPATLF